MKIARIALLLIICAIAVFPLHGASVGAAAPGRDLQIVAHEDDDVIFMNPDIENSIKAGDVVRTVFVTAGNVCPNGGGTCADLPGRFPSDTQYWQSRERGALAAYATMAGVITQTLDGSQDYSYFRQFYDFSTHTVPGNCGAQPCTIDLWTLKGTPTPGQVSVTFLRVSAADTGSGMWPLEKLWQGSLSSLMTVGSVGSSYQDTTAPQNCDPAASSNPPGCRTYTAAQLISLISGIMQDFGPTRLRLQDASASDYTVANKDHTDHLHAARLALEAYWNYLSASPPVQPSLLLYRAYYTEYLPANVQGPALAAKAAALDNNCVFDPPTGGPGCYTDASGWGQREYALSGVRFAGPLMSGVLLDTGVPGCLGVATGQATVSLVPCSAGSPSLWLPDSLGHLRIVGPTGQGQCLTIPTSGLTAGITSTVQVGPCASASDWIMLSNGMLVGNHGKVLQAASNGAVQAVDLFSYNSDLNQGGVGNVPVLDLTDLGDRWTPGVIPLGAGS